MTPDPNFPRWMFHPTKDAVIVNSQDELDDLGPEWSKKIFPPGDAAEAAPSPENGAGAPEPETEQPRRRGRPPKTA